MGMKCPSMSVEGELAALLRLHFDFRKLAAPNETRYCVTIRDGQYLILGFVHTGADPFWICSRLGPIHTGPVCTALERIRPKGVRM